MNYFFTILRLRLFLLIPLPAASPLRKLPHGLSGLKDNFPGEPQGILVGTKLDVDSSIVDSVAINKFLIDNDFYAYYPTSAKTARGLDELYAGVYESIDWEFLAKITRPALFQTIRDEVALARANKEIILLRSDLNNRVKAKLTTNLDRAATKTVIDQLAMQEALRQRGSRLRTAGRSINFADRTHRDLRGRSTCRCAE
jgi:hypothetical protein